MKTRNIFLVLTLVLALAAIAIVGCSNRSQITDPQPADNQSGSVTPTDSLNQRGTVEPAAAAISWNSLSALSKRQFILQTGYAENGGKFTPNCKAWANHIVNKASNGIVSLPATCPNASGYYFCSGRVTQILQNQSAYYTYFIPGRVLQMQLRLTNGTIGPHTAFVFASSSSGISMLDCNYIGGAGNGNIGVHYMSWTDFYKKIAAYTLYEVY